jgi:hypothetical protein
MILGRLRSLCEALGPILEQIHVEPQVNRESGAEMQYLVKQSEGRLGTLRPDSVDDPLLGTDECRRSAVSAG